MMFMISAKLKILTNKEKMVISEFFKVTWIKKLIAQYNKDFFHKIYFFKIEKALSAFALESLISTTGSG